MISPTHSPASRRLFLKTCAVLAGSHYVPRLPGADENGIFNVDERLRTMLAAAPLRMKFEGRSAGECVEWQRQFGAKLASLFGPFRPPSRWESVLERTVENPDHIREERLLVAPGLDPVPVHLLRPRGQTAANGRKRPGIVAIHGHGMSHDSIAGRDDTPELKAEIERYRCDYGLQLVRRGYVVAAPCLTPFGRRLGAKGSKSQANICETTNLRLQILGKYLMAENLRDILWAFECLIAQADVDSARVGCVGLSLGGRMAMLTTAVEPRIRIGVLAGCLNCLQERAITGGVGGCQMVPGLLEYGDVPEIAGLIAPRPILWLVGSQDRLLDPEWAERALQRIRRVYRAAGAENAVTVDRFDGGHVWRGDVAHPLLDRVLIS